MSRRRFSMGGEPEAGWSAGGRRMREETELDITPMIDVTFLLLIFFMVTSTMKGNPDADLPVAKHGKGVDTSAVTTILIRANPDGGEPQLELENLAVNLPRQPVTLQDITNLVQTAVTSDVPDVIIKADRTVPHGDVQKVARAVNAVEGVQFFVGVQDKNR